MIQKIRKAYRFLPVQLCLLHFRKYQVLLLFWLLLFLVITGNFASRFGAASLFLSPEYLGKISVAGFALLGGAMAIFVMGWHITTFIIHSKRVPFLGATRHSFLKYCINNSIIPLVFLITYSFCAISYLKENEMADSLQILLVLLGFYFGFIVVLVISFLYFFRADRNILKILLNVVANPSVIREIIPYDSLDNEFDLIRAETYIDSFTAIRKIEVPYKYNHRFLSAVLRRHHRNAVFAIAVAVVLLLFLGIFMEQPLLRIPAGSGFLLLFSIVMSSVGAFKYFLRSWEFIGWIILVGSISWMVHVNIFDWHSIAYGINYNGKENRPEYDYDNLKTVFSPEKYYEDLNTELNRLNIWKSKLNEVNQKPPLVIISVSGGGSRAAYWTFRTLQYCDSLSGGQLFQNAVLITGASGGMIGAAYWRSIHTQYNQGNLKNPYSVDYQQNMGKDLLNSIIFSLACVDLISPFNKITIGGKKYVKDRGYAFDRELERNTNGLLEQPLQYYKSLEEQAMSPMVLLNSTIINDGRRLLMSTLPVGYMTRSRADIHKENPIIDAVDFAYFFKKNDPLKLKISSALRMNATFPIILPVVKLPSYPGIVVMDAGLRDNYGSEIAFRYLYNIKEWAKQNTGNVILLQIRDTKEYEPSEIDKNSSLSSMLLDPVFAIQNKWSSFQTYQQNYTIDYIHSDLKDNFHKITLRYLPQNDHVAAALNFHLTEKEKADLLRSVYHKDNQIEIKKLIRLLK